MYCTKCGRENGEGVKFCSYCGAMMEMPAQADNAALSNDNAESVPEAAPSLQSGPPEISEQSEVSVQPEALKQPEAAEQTVPEQPKASEQPKAPEQPWMTSQPEVVEQPWMAGQTVGAASVQMPDVAQANVPPVQVPQAAQTNMPPVQMGQIPSMPGQMPVQNGQMPPMPGQMPVQGGQMPSMPGQMPLQNGQMPPMQGGQVPPINGQRPPMPYSAVPPANPAKKKGNGAGKAILGIMIALLLVGIGVVAFLFINKSSQEKKLQNQLETAANYMADGSYEDAVAAYLEILEKNPENTEAIDGLTDTYIKWAERYANDENYEEAISILQGADDHANSKTIKKKISEYEDALAAMNQKGFTDADLVFWDGADELTVELNHALIIRSRGTYYTSYADASYEEYGEYATNRGLKLGDSLEDYRTLYEVEPGYSAWELYSGENNEYTSFAEYSGQSPAEMYNSYNNVWLDIGFSKENGEWRALTDVEIKETWFCDAPLYDYEEVVVFAVNFNEWGEVIGLSLEHFSYDEGWVDWQAWDDGSDSGDNGNGDGDGDFGYTGDREGFTDEDLYFSDGYNKIEVSLNCSFIVYPNGSQILSYADADYATSEALFSTNRGLEIGMLLDDYRELYYVEPGYAVWELFRGENNEYTSFAEYTGQSPADMYDGTYNNAWLDIGFCKENGEWRAMLDYEVRDTWFCDADLDDYEEVVVFAVNLNEWGEVCGLSLEHFSYDDGWVEWQGWAN